MPADAIAGLAEAVAGLVAALVEAIAGLVALAIELLFWLIQAIFGLIGKPRQIERPAWVIKRRERSAGRVIMGIVLLAAVSAFTVRHTLFTQIRFSHGGFSRPDQVTVTLIRDSERRDDVIENGKLLLFRGRWDHLVVSDPRYKPATIAIAGRRMDVRLEGLKSTREKATDAVLGKAAELLRERLSKPQDTATTPESP